MGLEIRALSASPDSAPEVPREGFFGDKNAFGCASNSTTLDPAAQVKDSHKREYDNSWQQSIDRGRLLKVPHTESMVNGMMTYGAASSSGSDSHKDHILEPYEVPLRRRPRFIECEDGNGHDEEQEGGHQRLVVCSLGSQHLATV